LPEIIGQTEPASSASSAFIEKEQLNGKNNGGHVEESDSVEPSPPPAPDGLSTPEQLKALREHAERLDIPELAEVEPTFADAQWCSAWRR
jgi:hypothetical protein